ncbi:hypothetical protein B9W68_16275 [Streptomyces sp. CS227]|nr:hypothetical protein B9W68_16275 [Streptomyces sp. CS227]
MRWPGSAPVRRPRPLLPGRGAVWPGWACRPGGAPPHLRAHHPVPHSDVPGQTPAPRPRPAWTRGAEGSALPGRAPRAPSAGFGSATMHEKPRRRPAVPWAPAARRMVPAGWAGVKGAAAKTPRTSGPDACGGSGGAACARLSPASVYGSASGGFRHEG